MTRSLALELCARDALRVDHDVLCEWIGTLLGIGLDVLIYIDAFAGMDGDRHHRIHVTRLIKEKPKASRYLIKSKHITLRTRIKRLVRRTICFSKIEQMHDLVIGLLVNRYEFGLPL